MKIFRHLRPRKPDSGWSVAELSLKRPVTAIMFFISMVVIGLIASFRLPLEQFPDVQFPFVFVNAPYPGSTPQEVERTVVRPMEEALATLPGIKRMYGNASADNGNVGLEMDWERDVEVAASNARDRLDAIRDELPEDLQRYFVMKFSTTDQPVLGVRLASKRDLRDAYDLIERELKRRIERLPGVARVEITGVMPNEVEIAIDADRVNAHGLALNELAEKLRAVNFSVSAGLVDEGERRLRVQPVGEVHDLDELRNLVLDNKGLRLGDIADVHLKPQRPDIGRRLEGRPAVGINIFKERNANLVEVGRLAVAEMDEIAKEPSFEGIEIKLLNNQADDVTTSLRHLVEAGGIGLVLSVAVLFFFLRHWPSTLMVTLAIPVCFIMTLGFMYFFGLSLNILTMMGLLLAIGMLVDNAVVVVESIYQEREKFPNDPQRASIVGTRHVAIALSAGTLCHCIVFVPNLFAEKNEISIFMVQIAITISVSLLASWLVAVSLIPMLSARMKTPPAAIAKAGIIHRMQEVYAGFLRWTLIHRGWSLLGILAIVLLSIVPITLTKFDFFPNEAGRRLFLGYEWKGAYTLEQKSAEVGRIEAWLDAHREKLQITQVYSFFSELDDTGTQIQLREDEAGWGEKLRYWWARVGPGEADAALAAKMAELRDTKEVMEEIRKGLPKSARATIGFDVGRGDSGNNTVQVSLVGDSSETLKELGRAVVPVLARNKQLRDVRVDIGDENSELAVRVDRERAAQYGFSAEQVAQFVGIALRGTPLREFRRGETEVPVWLRFAGAEGFSIEDLSGFTLRAPNGTAIPLLSVVNVRIVPAASRISRVDRQTTLQVKANLAEGVTVPEARKLMEEALKDVTMPAGYRYTFDGAFQRDDDASQQMLFNTLIALVMIYIVMAAVFESLLFPAAIMSSVVFSIFGVFWLFAITGTTFSIMASIGILVLMGVVVNNGIVMVEHINTRRRAGLDRTEALVQGSRERLRPILMTMGTAILGMVPLCIEQTSSGDGPPYHPMARAIAGGLAFSTVVSLLFLPTIYAMLDDLRAGTVKLIRRARDRAPLGRPVREG